MSCCAKLCTGQNIWTDDESLMFPLGNKKKMNTNCTSNCIELQLSCFLLVTNVLPERKVSIHPSCKGASVQLIFHKSWNVMNRVTQVVLLQWHILFATATQCHLPKNYLHIWYQNLMKIMFLMIYMIAFYKWGMKLDNCMNTVHYHVQCAILILF